MTETETGEFDFAAFFTKNRKPILTGAGTAVAAVAIGWFWVASQNLKAEKAETAFGNAERAFYSGNPQLAETELSKMAQRYGGTPAGVRATILLAQTYFETGKPDQGVSRLRDVVGSAAKAFRAPIYALIGAGLDNQKKFDSAATAYAQAAVASPTVMDREGYLARQAVSLTAAGKNPDAIKVWQAIAAHETSPLAPEAKLRLGELSAAPAKGS
jgi:predicted negative regulator of RcsB-dependent stress response